MSSMGPECEGNQICFVICSSQLQLSLSLTMSIGATGDFKNVWIQLKFETLAPWVNILGDYFFTNLLRPFFTTAIFGHPNS